MGRLLAHALGIGIVILLMYFGFNLAKINLFLGFAFFGLVYVVVGGFNKNDENAVDEGDDVN